MHLLRTEGNAPSEAACAQPLWCCSPKPFLSTLQAEVDAAAAMVSTLEAQQAARTVEQVQLKRQLHAARQVADPHIIQARRLGRSDVLGYRDIMERPRCESG